MLYSHGLWHQGVLHQLDGDHAHGSLAACVTFHSFPTPTHPEIPTLQSSYGSLNC